MEFGNTILQKYEYAEVILLWKGDNFSIKFI